MHNATCKPVSRLLEIRAATVVRMPAYRHRVIPGDRFISPTALRVFSIRQTLHFRFTDMHVPEYTVLLKY